MTGQTLTFCDLTLAYNETSGGIRTYIDQKRRFLLENTAHSHLLVIPGEADRVERGERTVTVQIASPHFPGQGDYRFFVWPPAIRRALDEHAPDAIELGSYYITPYPAFAYRDARRAEGRACIVGGFFHTDIAQAYAGAPIRALAHGKIGDFSETLSALVESIGNATQSAAEDYFAALFGRCDLRIASTPDQAERLKAYGCEDVEVVPLGVDLELFRPKRRDDGLRSRLGAGPGGPVLLYVGRLGAEKHVDTLVDAFERLPRDLDARLWVIGDGPDRGKLVARAKKTEGFSVLPYESDRERLADLLASADIYVTAGPHETFGLSVIEAQASGLPVVGVEAGALIDRVVPGTGFLGPVDDAGAMAANIRRAYAKRDELAANARAHVEAHFSWTISFTRLTRLYEERVRAARGETAQGGEASA